MDHDEEVIARRGFPEMEDDDEVYKYATIVSGNWFYKGSQCNFIAYKLNESMNEHPYHDLTLNEFARLRLRQKNEIDKEKALYYDEGWVFLKRNEYPSFYEDLYVNKRGERTTQIVPKIKY